MPGRDHKRILIYSHDTFGLGHLRRCRAIAHSLVGADSSRTPSIQHLCSRATATRRVAMAVFMGAFPVLPGKEDEVRKFAQETLDRSDEFEASERRSG